MYTFRGGGGGGKTGGYRRGLRREGVCRWTSWEGGVYISGGGGGGHKDLSEQTEAAMKTVDSWH